VSTSHPDPAVREESRLMDYGDDWPPAPETEPDQFKKAVRREMRQILRKRRKWALWQKAVARVVVFGVIWAGGAIVLQMLVPAGNTIDIPIPPQHAVVNTR
jgi:anti-sigma factor RsiW